MTIIFDKPIDIIYETWLEELCKYYEDNEEFVIKHLIACAYGDKIGFPEDK